MHLWAQGVVVICLVAVTVVLVPTVLAVRRSAERADRVLAFLEGELRPLLGEMRELVQELRGLGGEAREELQRVGDLTDRAQNTVEGVGRVLGAVAGLTRAGQLVGVAAGLKAGLDMFLRRLRRHARDGKQEGDHHER